MAKSLEKFRKRMKTEVKTITKLPEMDLITVYKVYVGKPRLCMCGCAGTYSYSSVNAKKAGKDRGRKVTPEEINDDEVSRIYKKMKKYAHLGMMNS